MSSRPFFLLPLCFVSALALNAYAALDPTGVYQDYLEDPVPEKMPILEDLYNLLRKQEEAEAAAEEAVQRGQ